MTKRQDSYNELRNINNEEERVGEVDEEDDASSKNEVMGLGKNILYHNLLEMDKVILILEWEYSCKDETFKKLVRDINLLSALAKYGQTTMIQASKQMGRNHSQNDSP